MGINSIDVGELIYEALVNFTSVTEYGINLNELLSGTSAPSFAGTRIDIAFQGTVQGPRLSGSITGIDYLEVRADGQVQLHIHARIETHDGVNISFFADGVAIPEEGNAIAQLRENITFITASPDYAWVNQLLGWGQGTVDLEKGEVKVKAYAA